MRKLPGTINPYKFKNFLLLTAHEVSQLNIASFLKLLKTLQSSDRSNFPHITGHLFPSSLKEKGKAMIQKAAVVFSQSKDCIARDVLAREHM